MKRYRRDILIDVAAHLAGAISLLERTKSAKKAAASDKMFDQMLKDYKASLARARKILNEEDCGQEAEEDGSKASQQGEA